MQPLGVTTLRAIWMIERRDTPHWVNYWVVHRSDFESSDNEEPLSETIATKVPPIPAITLVVAVATPSSLIAALTPSAPPALEERLASLKKGQVSIEGLLRQILVHLHCQDPSTTLAPTSLTITALMVP